MSEASITPETVKPSSVEGKQESSSHNQIRRITQAHAEDLMKGGLDIWPSFYGVILQNIRQNSLGSYTGKALLILLRVDHLQL